MLTKKEIMKEMPKEYFKVVDLYEDYGTIDRALNIKDAKKIQKQHFDDCDGECDVLIIRYVLKDGIYICKGALA